MRVFGGAEPGGTDLTGDWWNRGCRWVSRYWSQSPTHELRHATGLDLGKALGQAELLTRRLVMVDTMAGNGDHLMKPAGGHE